MLASFARALACCTTQLPEATTTGQRPPHWSTSASQPPPWSGFDGEFPTSPRPKLRSPRCRASLVLLPDPRTPPVHRFGRCPQCHGMTLPSFHCGLPAQPNVGRPEVAQWNNSFVIFLWNCLNQFNVRFIPFKICLNFKYFWNLIKSTLIIEFKYIL
jgi:hypothetical protein